MNPLTATSLYAAIFGLLFIVITLRVGLYRRDTNILFGDGDDKQLLLRIRAQANFTETVPIALILIALMELAGANAIWLYSLGSLLVIGRTAHYLQLSGLIRPILFRAWGMLGTFLVYVTASVWLLLNVAV
jgi:uncharacterized membrane protein YecN with MAPEG domain